MECRAQKNINRRVSIVERHDFKAFAAIRAAHNAVELVGEEITDGAADDIGNALQRLYCRIVIYRLRQSTSGYSFAVNALPFIGYTLQCVAVLFYDFYYIHLCNI